MSEIRFVRWLAAIGVFGGVLIALVLPVVVLMLGEDLSSAAKLTVVILALIGGVVLAGLSAVVGITIPTTVSGAAFKISDDGGISLSPIADCCQPKEGADRGEECCPPRDDRPDEG
jgi:hypothetical protein